MMEVNTKRTIKDVPEGGCHVNDLHKYKVVDSPDHNKLGEGVNREWAFTYHDLTEVFPGGDRSFIIHADNIEDAFDHFISIRPRTLVKAVEYYGIHF